MFFKHKNILDIKMFSIQIMQFQICNHPDQKDVDLYSFTRNFFHVKNVFVFEKHVLQEEIVLCEINNRIT